MKKQTTTIALITALLSGALSLLASADSLCFNEAGAEYGVAPQLLWAISKRESDHNPFAYNRNTDGSYDYCHMQINSSSWYDELGKDRWEALADPCQCTRTGAWILSKCVKKYGYTWKAVGCYHSQTPDKRDKYALDIANIIKRSQFPLTVSPQQENHPPATNNLTKLVWGDTSAAPTP